MTDNKAALDALERLLNDALSSRDGYGSSRADAELIRAALQRPEQSEGEPTVRYKNSLSEKEYPDHDLTTGALAALSNVMILTNADSATFEIENDIDGRFVFEATRIKPGAALAPRQEHDEEFLRKLIDTVQTDWGRGFPGRKEQDAYIAKAKDAYAGKIKLTDNTEEAPRQADEWQPIETAPRGGVVFVCRHKDKPYVTFEAAIFRESESWEMPQEYDVLHNMTTDEPIDGWDDFEWMPLPPPPSHLLGTAPYTPTPYELDEDENLLGTAQKGEE